MRITFIDKRMKVEHPAIEEWPVCASAQGGRLKGRFLWCGLCLGMLLTGCSRPGQPAGPQALASKADEYYRKAVAAYELRISSSSRPDDLYLELGRLYFKHGEFVRAAEAFGKSASPGVKKDLAVTYYRMGNPTDALEIFNREDIDDDEYRYYHGLTAEKLNLYDQALKIYRQVRAGEFASPARNRIEAIERLSSTARIESVDPGMAAVIAQAPSAETYPQAGAFILACNEEIEVSDAGTSVSTLHYAVKILNERGKEGFSETQISYDSTFEKVELVYARTIKPDGTVVEVGRRHLRDVSRYLNFPLYSNARVFIISFPEVAAGSTVEYTAKVYNNQLIDKKHAVFNYGLKTREPIIDARFSLIVPRAREVRIKTINGEYNDCGARLDPVVEERGGTRMYRWAFKDIPQIIPEANMPPDVEINPTVMISTFGDWQEIYAWWWNLAKDKIEADDTIRAQVRDLAGGKMSDEERMRAIYNFCARKIRYVAVEYGQAGYEPHKAQDVFRNKYGDCKDKAILLVTMLREAGFTAWPVLIATDEYYNLRDDFPAVLFNHCIAAVKTAESVVFLDPTAETCPFGDLPAGDQGRRVLVIKDDSYEILQTPRYSASHNSARQDLSISLKDDGSIEAQRRVHTKGLYDQGQRYWLLYTMPELIKESLTERVQQISAGGALDSYEIEHLNDLNTPLVLRYAFRGPEYGSAAGRLKILPQIPVMDAAVAAREKRVYPLDFGALTANEYNFKIMLPPGFKVYYMPADIVEESPWMSVAVSYTRKDSALYVSQKNILKEKSVSREDYPEFRKFIERAAGKMKELIVLERVK